MNDISLSFQPNRNSSSPTKGSLIVRQGEKVLITDTLDVASSRHQKKYIRSLVEQHTGLAKYEDELQEQILEIAAKQIENGQQGERPEDVEDENQPLQKSRVELAKTDSELIELAKKLLRSPDLIEKIVDHVHMLGVAGEDKLITAVYIIGTSRLLSKPLAGLVMGVSSAGKSYVINTVSRLLPDEAVLRAHQISPKALQYLPPGSLIHRFVVAGERSRMRDDAAAEATRALREMISDGKLSALVSVSQRSGPHQTVHIEQEGPIAYVESTTLGVQDIFNEDRTRFVILCSDESAGQSQAIVDKIAQSVSTPADPDTPDSIIALHRTAQRLLGPVEVVVPFAANLKDCLPLYRVEVRRTFGHMVSLIQAVALLHQFQRSRNEKGQIVAKLYDYEIVRQYLAEPLATSLGCGLTPGAKELLEKVKSVGEYALSEVEGQVPYSINTVRSRNRELVAGGYVVQTEQARGRAPAKFIVAEDQPVSHGLVLPELKSEEEENFVIETLQTVDDKT